MKLVAIAIGVALLVWTVADVGPRTLASQASQLGVMLPLLLALAGLRFVMQAAGWRLAMGDAPRPSLLQAWRAVVAGEAAGYLTWGPISREPVKAVLVSGQTPERVSLRAAIVERAAYMGAAIGLVAVSLVLVAIRANRLDLVAPVAAAVLAGLAVWAAIRRRSRAAVSTARLAKYGWDNPPAVWGIASLAILQEITNVLEAYVVLAWLGSAPAWEAAIAFEGLNRLANAPAQLIPGKLGGLELASSSLAGALELGSASGLTLALARRLRSLAWTAVGILLLSTSASRGLVRREPAVV